MANRAIRAARQLTGAMLAGCALVATLGAQREQQQQAAEQQVRKLDGSGDWTMESLWTKETETAVQRGLAWLASQQNARGFWRGVVGDKSRERYVEIRPIAEQDRAGTGHVGVTAICGMAFLAGGHLPKRGKYGAVVQKTVDAVLSCVGENGLATEAGSRMYSHAFATLFLAEAYGTSRDKRIREGIEKAAHIIVDCQNHEGGWRYNAFSQEADVSVTVCQLQALRAIRNIGIRVPKQTIDRAAEYIKTCRVERSYSSEGLFSYQTGRRTRKTRSYSIQAAALTSLVSAGVYDRELIEPALEFLTQESDVITEDYPHHFFFWYGSYYASQVFFHADGLFGTNIFKRYYENIRDHLLDDQETDGRWQNPPEIGPGDPFGTAVACIVLQIPNQYLPIFQR